MGLVKRCDDVLLWGRTFELTGTRKPPKAVLCATRLPLIYCNQVTTSARSRNCWGTPTSRQRWSIRTSLTAEGAACKARWTHA